MQHATRRGSDLKGRDALVDMDLVHYNMMVTDGDRNARKRLVSEDGTINIRG